MERDYSLRMATMGSMREARRAGSQAARRATAASSAAIEAKVRGSRALTPKSRLVSTRVKPRAPSEPSAIPLPTPL